MNSFTHIYLSTVFPLFVLVVRFRAKSLSTYKERSVCTVLLTFVHQQLVLVGVQNCFKLSLTWKTEGIDPNRRKPTSRILGEKQRAQEKTDTTAHKGLRPTETCAATCHVTRQSLDGDFAFYPSIFFLLILLFLESLLKLQITLSDT